jgi:CRISPR system Cascade subunit CasA
MNRDEICSFSLIDQPWLLVRQSDGTVTELSMMDTFAQAHSLAGLVGDVPTQVFAVTRLLLSVVHRAIDGPRDADHWAELWEGEQLPSDEMKQYLERHRSRFDLLHKETPFFQVAELHTSKNDISALNKLIADIPNGNPFFSSRIDPDLSLSFAEAARWVVHCQAFDTSGIKSGAVGDKRVKGGRGYPIGTGWSGLLGGIIPEGRTLKETLLLNLIASDFDFFANWKNTDMPAWERPPETPENVTENGRAPLGPLDLYTWQSRHIRLSHDGRRVTGVLICNGERRTPQNQQGIEPHTAWRRSKPQEQKMRVPLVYMPKEHDPQRAIWRGLQSLLPAAEKTMGADAPAAVSPLVLEWLGKLDSEGLISSDFPVQVRAIGMTYGSQSSTVEEIIDDALAIRAVLLKQEAEDLVGAVVAGAGAVEKSARALGYLAANLAQAAGGEPEGQKSRAVELAFAELDVVFREWLSRLKSDTDPTDAQITLQRKAYRLILDLGRELVENASTAAWVGRIVKGNRLTTAHADIWFRRELNRALTLAHEEVAVPA